MNTTKTTISSILVLTLFITTITTTANARMVGQRIEVKNVKTNKEIQDLGRFSVREYNKSLLDMAPSPLRSSVGGGAGGLLVFQEVVEAQRQVVAGIKYYLKIAAMRDGLSKTYDAVVVVKPWVQSRQLLSFGPSTS